MSKIKRVEPKADHIIINDDVYTYESLVEAVREAGKIPITWGIDGPIIGEVTTFRIIDNGLTVTFDVSKGE